MRHAGSDSPSEITFGTDGWRAVIADSFTFSNVRRVSQAIAAAARNFTPPDGIDRNAMVVSFDRRFLSREFALEVCEALRAAGYRVILSKEPTPSQTVSFTAWKRKLLGGIVVTASHNPAIYNGLKFKAWYGGSGLPQMYRQIAENLDGEVPRREGGSIEQDDLLDDYVQALRENVNVSLLHEAHIAILHDPLYGVSSGLPRRVLEDTADALITTIRGEANPGFGGVNPEPIPQNLDATVEMMRSGRYALAICNDGDADRLGILDESGAFVSPHKVIALLALYLVRHKKESGEIVKTFSTSRLVENVARGLGVTFHETAIGFKYVADLMLTRRILIGGEESGGVGFGSFLPERDGVLSGLLVAECVAAYGKPLSEIVTEMENEFGRFFYDRRDVQSSRIAIDNLVERASRGDLDGLFGMPVMNREEKDGVKLNFKDGSWLLFRRSGTEPIIRIYCESPNEELVGSMLDVAVRELGN